MAGGDPLDATLQGGHGGTNMSSSAGSPGPIVPSSGLTDRDSTALVSPVLPPLEESTLSEIPDESLVQPAQAEPASDSHSTDDSMEPAPTSEDYEGATTPTLPSMLNSNAIPLEEDASGDLSTSSNEALTLTSTVSRGNYHQCGSARRVKVYELKGENWFDRGTGYCAGVYDETVDEALLVARREEKCQFLEGIDVPSEPVSAERSKLDGSALGPDHDKVTEGEGSASQAQACQFVVVVSENLETEDVLLASKVVKEEVYQRQQDTLVVWTEPSGVDMALSFQEAEGCNEVWEFLTEVQKHFMGLNEEVLTDSPPTTPNPHSPGGALGMSGSGVGMESLLDNVGSFIGLPEPSLANLERIDLVLKDVTSRGPLMREKLTAWLMESQYIRKLTSFFYSVEELEALPSLHMLCIIMQTILLLNDSFIFEFILQDDVFLGVVGMLEYDPEFPRLKANYREHLTQRAKFKQVVEIGDPMIVSKIHQTYRLLYLKDVVLARVVDDPTVSILNSFIFFHQNDIVNFCCQNEIFLGQLFGTLTDPEESDERRSEGVLFLQQLCAMGKHIQLPSRIALYRTLTECGLLNVLQYGLERLGQTARNAAAEVLMTIIEYDANSVRAHIVTQVEQNTRPLISMMIDMLHNERDPGLKTQIAEATRIIFDVASDGGPMGTQAHALSVQNLNKIKPDPDRFLTWIYENEIGRLCSPLTTLPDFRVLSKGEKLPIQPRHRSALFGHLCDLLCHMIFHHSFRSQYYVLTSEISKKVGSLLHSRDKYIRLSALRFFKYCLASNNQFTNRHFVKLEVFGAILDLMEAESDRNNLVSSACLDLFEHVKRDNIKLLIGHFMEKFTPQMRHLAKSPHVGNCFQSLVQQWEKNHEPAPSVSNEVSQRDAQIVDKTRQQRDQARRGPNRATIDADEESYFNAEGDQKPSEAGTSRLALYGNDDDEDSNDGTEAADADTSGSPLSRIPEKRRRGDDEEEDDNLTRLAKRKPGRGSKSRKSAASTQGEGDDDDQQHPGGFIRSMANSISNTFGSGSGAKSKKDTSRSPSPKTSKVRSASAVEPVSPSASLSGKSGSGVKKISLGLSSSSKKMAGQNAPLQKDEGDD